MDFEVCTKAPDLWARMTIDDVCTRITSGGTPSRRNSEFFINGSVPWVKTQELQDGWIRETEEQITEDAVKSSSAKILPPRTVLLAMYGATVGQLGVLASPMACNQACCALIVNDKVADFRYVYYLLLQHREVIKSLATGAAQQNLSAAQIKQFRFAFPDRQAQGQVADVLAGLDAKIDLNSRINQTLEAMAQAIFKSWFVEFDPVKAKITALAAGRDPLRAAMSAISGKAEAELDTLPPEAFEQLASTAALFPDAMDESELGEIPKGWTASPFGSLVSHAIGGDWGSDAPDDANDTRVAIIRGTDIPDLDLAQSLRVPIRYTTRKKLSSRQLQAGDIVLEVSGGSKDQPTGRSIRITTNMMSEFDCPLEPASFCRLLRPVNSEIGVILGLHLTHIYTLGKTWEYQNQSTGIANFQTSHFLESERVVNPSAEVAEKFYTLVNPLLERRHDPQSRRLAEVRDALLPKLLSGELSVSTALTEVDA